MRDDYPVWRRLLKLPPEGLSWAKYTERSEAAAQEPSNPWLQYSAGETAAAPTRPGLPAPAQYQSETDVAKLRRRQRLLRGVLTVAVLLFAWIGVRETFITPQLADRNAAPPAAPPAFPQVAAAGAAERFAAAYLTWDEGNPDQREEALTQVWAGDSKLGWNGAGKQSVTSATAVEVRSTSDNTAVVTVAVAVTGDRPGQVALAVPVVTAGGAASVAQAPAMVPVPQPAAPEAPGAGQDQDSNLTMATKPLAEQFFAAYAAQEDLGTIAAPGSPLRGMAGAVEFVSLDSWEVSPADGEQAEARASVTWRRAGAQLKQSYVVTLQRTTAGTTSRWQIATIN